MIIGDGTSCLSLSGQRGLSLVSSPHGSPPADSIFFPPCVQGPTCLPVTLTPSLASLATDPHILCASSPEAGVACRWPLCWGEGGAAPMSCPSGPLPCRPAEVPLAFIGLEAVGKAHSGSSVTLLRLCVLIYTMVLGSGKLCMMLAGVPDTARAPAGA